MPADSPIDRSHIDAAERGSDALDDNERVGDAGRISSMIAERTMVAEAMTALPDPWRDCRCHRGVV